MKLSAHTVPVAFGPPSTDTIIRYAFTGRFTVPTPLVSAYQSRVATVWSTFSANGPPPIGFPSVSRNKNLNCHRARSFAGFTFTPLVFTYAPSLMSTFREMLSTQYRTKLPDTQRATLPVPDFTIFNECGLPPYV